jgi:hypothetical protein
MAIITRTRRLGRLAFFFTLAATAAVIDACGGTKTSPRQPSAGMGGAPEDAGTGTGGALPTGGSGGADAGSQDASDLWDVICE